MIKIIKNWKPCFDCKKKQRRATHTPTHHSLEFTRRNRWERCSRTEVFCSGGLTIAQRRKGGEGRNGGGREGKVGRGEEGSKGRSREGNKDRKAKKMGAKIRNRSIPSYS